MCDRADDSAADPGNPGDHGWWRIDDGADTKPKIDSNWRMKASLDFKRSRTVLCAATMLITVAGCGGGSLATYSVNADGLAADATVDLEYCGRTTPMTRTDAGFTASIRVTCEGEARLRIGQPDGRELACDAGYISLASPDALYEVTVVDRQCMAKVSFKE